MFLLKADKCSGTSGGIVPPKPCLIRDASVYASPFQTTTRRQWARNATVSARNLLVFENTYNCLGRNCLERGVS